jgi:hypothetical protein
MRWQNRTCPIDVSKNELVIGKHIYNGNNMKQPWRINSAFIPLFGWTSKHNTIRITNQSFVEPPFTDQILFLVFIQMSSFIIHLLLLVITSSLGPSQRALTGLGTCVPGDSRPMEKSGCWKSSKCDVLNFKDKIYKHMVIMCIYILCVISIYS